MLRESLKNTVLLGLIKIEERHQAAKFMISLLLDPGGADTQFFSGERASEVRGLPCSTSGG